MINPFVLKKFMALLLPPLITTTSFYVGLTFYRSIWFGIAFMLGGMLISVIIANMLLNNPFRAMLEGKGLMMLDINSTGIMQPYIMRLELPFIKGNKGDKEIKDTFDREKIVNLAPPISCKKTTAKLDKEGGVSIDLETLKLEKEKLNQSRFAFFHFPVILYNSVIKSVVDKNFLSENEQEAFTDHLAYHLLNSLEETSNTLRHLTRYVAEQLRPVQQLFKNKWVLVLVIVIVLIFIGVLVWKGAPMFSNAFASSAERVADAVGTTSGVVGVK